MPKGVVAGEFGGQIREVFEGVVVQHLQGDLFLLVLQKRAFPDKTYQKRTNGHHHDKIPRQIVVERQKQKPRPKWQSIGTTNVPENMLDKILDKMRRKEANLPALGTLTTGNGIKM